MDWKTWSPFQSKEVQQICANLTPDERSAFLTRGFMYGLWVVVTFAAPVALLMTRFKQIPTMSFVLLGALIITHIACIPVWQRYVKRFLCDTIWARDQGIVSTQLKLFQWH
tara:strand:+ start:17485 stop:17817 length:333 start_codon:yes stop_codon:yes gene_type:complete